MGPNRLPERDERTVAVENASYSWGYRFLAFALLVDVAWRSWRYGEAPWDLLGIVVASGLVLTACQARNRILTRKWAVTLLVTLAVAAVIGAMIAGLTH